MKDLVLLQNTIDHLGDKYPDSLIFVRGDANASFIQRNKNKRDDLFRYFVEENKFSPLLLNHKTYHHFLNNGLSDSNIDVIMYPKVTSDGLLSSTTKTLIKILCGKTNALVDSSHDVVITSLLLPPQPQPDVSPDNILAPKVKHSKYKVLWSEEGILEYQNLLSQTLPSLQSDYCDVSEPEVASVLFRVTNHILNEAAKRTNKCIELGKAPKAKKPFIPSEIKQALKSKEDALKKLNNIDARTATEKQSATDEYKSAKSVHQKLVRKHNISQEVDTDNDLLALLSKQPKEIFKSFRNAKAGQAAKVKTLHVGNKTYTEDNVADGFYDSISELKTISEITATSFERFAEDHRHIVEISKSGAKVPEITLVQAEALLKKIRPGVSDIFSITAAHYLNGGDTTLKHFQFLINTVLKNIELSSIDELNKAHAVILHKGHKKD